MTHTEMAECIRAMVRPILTLMFSTIYLIAAFDARPLPEHFFELTAGLVVWWFADRSLGHLLNGKNGGTK